MSRYDDMNRCRFCGAHIAEPCDPGCAAGDDTPEWDELQPDGVPCSYCGAATDEPCREGCVMLSATPWEDHAAAWSNKPWDDGMENEQ